MGHKQVNLRLFFLFTISVLILTGCARQIREPKRICPGKKSATEALSLLKLRSKNTVPLKANGQCRLQYYDAEGKRHNENFPVKVWVNPPTEIYLQGSIALNAKGIVLGSNEDEFWLAIKPKTSTYVWGQWSDEAYPEGLMINPKLVLEAVGITEVGSGKNWSLSKKDVFDILTKRNGHTESKKIYIEACDYLVKRIEHLDADRPLVVIELGQYKQVSEGFFVPAVINITKATAEAIENSVSINLNLKSIKSTNITLKQHNRLFTRPRPHRFKHIYKIVDGYMIEQQQ